ncbi:unnamed protein product, partial [Ilex paraguariensis]
MIVAGNSLVRGGETTPVVKMEVETVARDKNGLCSAATGHGGKDRKGKGKDRKGKREKGCLRC